MHGAFFICALLEVDSFNGSVKKQGGTVKTMIEAAELTIKMPRIGGAKLLSFLTSYGIHH